MLGNTGDPAVEGAIQKVLAACKRAGVPCGIITVGPEAANERIKQGFTNIILGIDVLTLLNGAKGALDQVIRPVQA
jgi:2-keto-3-deoxy-L-rhamnonate aldolase RhmA